MVSLLCLGPVHVDVSALRVGHGLEAASAHPRRGVRPPGQGRARHQARGAPQVWSLGDVSGGRPHLDLGDDKLGETSQHYSFKAHLYCVVSPGIGVSQLLVIQFDGHCAVLKLSFDFKV